VNDKKSSVDIKASEIQLEAKEKAPDDHNSVISESQLAVKRGIDKSV